jgi:hypothetical protein
MMDHYILNMQGEPVPEPSLRKWAAWFEVADRVVARTTVAPGVEVSTVFLGLDHSFAFGGFATLPVLWETLVFGGEHDGEMDRWNSRAAAVAGHWAWVVKLGGSMPAGPVPGQRRIDLE